ncbi:2-amino-4-hydroxy-6-hydroxymethyldihydropteridine diphosphokinase [Mongoliitalea daihaiensis]|uniref:2-amino-4-hydroxy-6- hydroxymethyldihydropteridine diphosphokinase n=1 Tax=Mongoliitalea daihaiensis TaxID=2782006 RepID=UPI001F2342FF|nr:2-amino-4-hydroxy-6-hydroxymethyldihydropteridine diphosphokinase [Mongoliitalea daihaiensis]UJP65199.1 2-amino-4-hydroxy-6-hydroxymethyldihydropteridine diphosphokinase [Mongoliitalea daihaiensis]
MEKLVLILGGNLGDREKLIVEAKKNLQLKLGSIVSESKIYETAAWGGASEGNYLNQVLILETDLEPLYILQVIQSIEQSLGRERIQKWGNRTMDIDILYLGNQIIKEPQLIVPHPYISERKFVLVPLVDVWPDFIHPIHQLSHVQLLQQLNDDLDVLEFIASS